MRSTGEGGGVLENFDAISKQLLTTLLIKYVYIMINVMQTKLFYNFKFRR